MHPFDLLEKETFYEGPADNRSFVLKGLQPSSCHKQMEAKLVFFRLFYLEEWSLRTKSFCPFIEEYWPFPWCQLDYGRMAGPSRLDLEVLQTDFLVPRAASISLENERKDKFFRNFVVLHHAMEANIDKYFFFH